MATDKVPLATSAHLSSSTAIPDTLKSSPFKCPHQVFLASRLFPKPQYLSPAHTRTHTHTHTHTRARSWTYVPEGISQPKGEREINDFSPPLSFRGASYRVLQRVSGRTGPQLITLVSTLDADLSFVPVILHILILTSWGHPPKKLLHPKFLT